MQVFKISSTQPAVGQMYNNQEMVAMGAAGHFPHAMFMFVPLNKISGTEPNIVDYVDTDGSTKQFAPGNKITAPVELEFSDGVYTLYNGNHRLKQAQINGDQSIPAFVHAASKQAYIMLKKSNGMKTASMYSAFAPGRMWMDPKGRFHQLDNAHDTHEEWAGRYLAKDTRTSDPKAWMSALRASENTNELFNLGWLRITPYGSDAMAMYTAGGKTPNQNQIKAMRDYLIAHSLDYSIVDNGFSVYKIWTEEPSAMNVAASTKTAQVHTNAPSYFYRVEPKGNFQTVMQSGLWTAHAAEHPGSYIDDYEANYWPDQEYGEGSYRLYFANKQWELPVDRFRIRVPASLLKDNYDLERDSLGDFFIDTGQESKQIVSPEQFDIDLGQGQWIRGDFAKDVIGRSKTWESYYKPTGYYKNKAHEEKEVDKGTEEV